MGRSGAPSPSLPPETHMLRFNVVLATACAAVALGATQAQASTVEASGAGGHDIAYTADPGETNTLEITDDWFNGSRFHVKDPGAVIHVGANCTSNSSHEATCD